MPPLKRQIKKPPRPGAGRPDTGIRSGYARVEVYLPTDVRDALDRLADRRQVQTGTTCRRSHIVREAVIEHLRKHLPEAGL